ncbi:hypothetical protein HN51_049929 [Arachis hypogaea]
MAREKQSENIVLQGMLHSHGELILMLDADGATKVTDLEKLENQANEMLSYALYRYFNFGFNLLAKCLYVLCSAIRFKLLLKSNFNMENQALVIQALESLIFLLLLLVQELILKRRLFGHIESKVVPQFFDEGVPSCGSLGCWSRSS